MTLDEAIKYTRELASQYEETAHKYFFDDKICFIANHEARKQTQLLKWLVELKSYREAERSCEFCEYENRDQLERPCSSCCRSYKDNFKAKKEGE
jgi:hypothetical protein